MKTFNEPWMSKINLDLLFRFWEHKKSNPFLDAVVHGTPLIYWRTPFGIIVLKMHEAL